MSEPQSVRDRVSAIQRSMLEAPQPEQVRAYLMTLTSLLGYCNRATSQADHGYKLVLLRAFDSEEAANRAKIRAETSAEYLHAREAKDTRDLVVEMIRSCKAYLRSLDEEMRLAR